MTQEGKEPKYFEAVKSGRAFNGAHRDAGTIVHAVQNNSEPSWDKALCGTVPGHRGNGWDFINHSNDPRSTKKAVNCIKCLKKI